MMDDRGETGGLAVAQYLVILVASGVVFMMFEKPMDQMHSRTVNQTNNQTAIEGANWVNTIATNYPLIIVLISVFGLLTLAFFERKWGA